MYRKGPVLIDSISTEFISAIFLSHTASTTHEGSAIYHMLNIFFSNLDEYVLIATTCTNPRKSKSHYTPV
jgi:hypothetical protein